MKIVSIKDVGAAEWNSVCDRSDQAWLFHRAEWVEIEAAYWALGNRSFALVNDRNETIGVQPLYLRENGFGAWTERVVDCCVHRYTGLALINDFMHWEAIKWATRNGYRHYRLGPVFPELPPDWPVARVSWFKKKFGGRSIPVIQGSYFLRPELYARLAAEEAVRLCEKRKTSGRTEPNQKTLYTKICNTLRSHAACWRRRVAVARWTLRSRYS